MYDSPIDGKQLTCVSKSRNDSYDGEGENLSDIASLTRGSKGTFSREAIAWFPFYLVTCIAQCENNELFRSLSELGRKNVSKRYFE